MDATRTRFGVVLMQRLPDGTERVVECRARAISRQEATGSATQLELACLIEALQWFSSLLRLIRFIFRSDHSSLIHLNSFKVFETQHARKAAELRDFT